MTAAPQIVFPPFRLDVASERLWRGPQVISLRPKTFAVLRYLAERPDQLVKKEDLLAALWPGTYVSESVLTGCLRDLRKALGDDAQAPHFIETVHRRGYRFIATEQGAIFALPGQAERRGGQQEVRPFSSLVSSGPAPTSLLIGRAGELRQLHKFYGQARAGARQVVFVTGEAGIGKTALVDAFVAQLQSSGDLWVGRGQCIEHYGAGEAYLPVLDALGRLCRAPGGEPLLALLAQHAPAWLVQMPALLSAAGLEAVQRKTQGATRERMLRELAEALEVLTREHTVVLVLEDLHWCDGSTLDWLAFLARRREPARLLVIGTYRPVEVLLTEHPLKVVKQELHVHGQCEEVVVELLSAAAVRQYLAQRFGGETLSAALSALLHQRCGGNPLFLVNIVEHLLAEHLLVQADGRWSVQGDIAEVVEQVPESLRHLIEQQSERLSRGEQRLLEVASVAGVEFSAAAVATGLAAELVDVEAHCEQCARRSHFLQARGTEKWPDGTVATRYSFLHALYQEVLYARLPTAQRVQWHQRIGEGLEAAYGARAGEIAGELAVHFERGRDPARAVQYHAQAARRVLGRSAFTEAIGHLTTGLELLTSLPDTLERVEHELRLQIDLGSALAVTRGYAVPEVERAYARARELCGQVGETPELFPVLWGLSSFYGMRGELQTAQALSEQMLQLAQRTHDPALLLLAHRVQGVNSYWQGELVTARSHLEQELALYDRQQHHELALRYGGYDPGVHCLGYLAGALWELGYPDQALQRVQEALTLAQELAHPPSLAYALMWAAVIHHCRREAAAAQTQAEAAMALAIEQGWAHFLAESSVVRGEALVAQGRAEEGITQIRAGLVVYQATGAKLAWPSRLAALAAAYGQAGQAQEGRRVMAEALAALGNAGPHISAAELYQLKGELTLQARVPRAKGKVRNSTDSTARGPELEAEDCFKRVLAIARQRSAKAWELRAVLSLSRLWQRQGKTEEARQLLADIYGWFTEGFETTDLHEAKALLAELR